MTLTVQVVPSPAARKTIAVTSGPSGLATSIESGTEQSPKVIALAGQKSPVIIGLYGGPRGMRGPAGTDVTSFTAAASINGHKLLVEVAAGQVAHADIADDSAPFLYVGMTETAAAVGATLLVRRFGPITFEGWSWVDGLVYLGTDGDPTQAPLEGSITFPVGFGSGTTLHLNPQPPVFSPL